MSSSPLSDHSPLADWLAHCERLHPVGIDLGLERVSQVWQRMGVVLGTPLGQEPVDGAPVVFTVAGTNGKGSTCAMLESILLQAGFKVGVYGSPHLVHFEERCRLMGVPCKAEDLVPHFAKVEHARGQTGLTYFEFTTLAILSLLAASGLDAVILEVGLGGRLDAVNIIDTDCAIVTSIDLDHMDYLGPDRESIGREKAGIMRAGRAAVVSDPQPPASIAAYAESIGADLWLFGRDHNYAGDRQQWSWGGAFQAIQRHGIPFFAWCQPVVECIWCARSTGGHAASLAGGGSGCSYRPGNGRVARALSDHPRAAHLDSGCGS